MNKAKGLINRKRLIGTPMILSFIALLAVGIIGIISGRYLILSQMKQDNIQLAQQIISEIQKNDISMNIIENLQQEHILSSNKLIEFLEQQGEKITNDFLTNLVQITLIDRITVYDQSGQVIASNYIVPRQRLTIGDPLYTFLNSDETEIIEGIRSDVITGDNYLYGAVKTSSGLIVQSAISAEKQLLLTEMFNYQTLVTKLMKTENIKYAYIVNDKYYSIADTDLQKLGLFYPEEQHPQVYDALNKEVSTNVIYEERKGSRILNIAAPIELNGTVTSALILGVSMDKLNQHIFKMTLIYVGIIVVFLLLMFWLQRHNVITPVHEFDDKIQAIDIEKNLSYRIKLHKTNPFNGLTNNINLILDKVEDYFKALYQSETTHRELFNTISDSLLILSIKEHNILDVNTSAVKMFGFSKEEFKTFTIENLSSNLPPYFHSNINGYIYRATKGETQLFEWNCVAKNKTTFYSENLLKLVSIAGQECILLAIRDINKRKEAELKVIEQQKQLDGIATNLPGVIFQLFAESDNNFYMKFVSERASDILGIKPRSENFMEELLSHIHPDDFQNLIISINHAINECSSWKHEARFIKRNGKILWLTGASTPIKVENGIIFNGIILDITESKEAEVERKRLSQQLSQSQKMDAIGQLAGGVAHDFNNMLGGILGAAQLIKLKTLIKEEGLEFLDLIIEATNQAGDLTKQLLTFSRKGHKAHEPVDIRKVVDKTINLLKRTIDKAISLSVHNTAEKTIVQGDGTMLQNAFMNIAINASHAMPDGGTIEFLVKNKPLDEHYCRAVVFDLEPGEFIEISIRDNGIGMSSAELNRIFEPFYTTKAQGQGTGLGLAATYGTVLDHHGAITVYSEVDKGTVFYIYLPVSGNEEVTTTENSKIFKGKGTILLIDDEEIIRKVGQSQLETLGYTVICAENGQIGLNKFLNNQTKIDLIILDMIMPVMGGKETLIKLRAVDNNVPVVISSGFSKEEDIEKIKEFGINAFISKPFTYEEISKTIKEHIRSNNQT